MLQIGVALFYEKFREMLLQIGGAQSLPIGVTNVTIWGSSYKFWQKLLQMGTIVTNQDNYYNS